MYIYIRRISFRTDACLRSFRRLLTFVLIIIMIMYYKINKYNEKEEEEKQKLEIYRAYKLI